MAASEDPFPHHSLTAAEAMFEQDNQLRPRRVLVNSIPKSGTTWVRTMLAALPGYSEFPMQGLTGTDMSELDGVRPGQVFHGHLRSSPELYRLLRARDFATVFVYRDLRDVVVSNYFHLSVLNPKRAPDSFKGRTKDELLDASVIPEWCVSAKRYPDIRNWIASDYPTVTYEELKANTGRTLLRVLQAMGFRATIRLCEEIVERTSFRAISGRRVGDEDPTSPLRKGIVGDWRNHLSAENTTRFHEKYGDLLREFGYSTELS